MTLDEVQTWGAWLFWIGLGGATVLAFYAAKRWEERDE